MNPTVDILLLEVKIAHLAVGVYPSVLLTFERTRSSKQVEVTVEVAEKRLLGPKTVAQLGISVGQGIGIALVMFRHTGVKIGLVGQFRGCRDTNTRLVTSPRDVKVPRRDAQTLVI